VAAALLLGFSTSPAFALGLGRVTVKSALGEPLRAEVDITDITPDELASLRTDVATPDTFRAHGLDYNPALGTVTITLERRPDGRPLLVLRSPRAVNDPFIDLVLETSWTGGRITRDYTLLFDPPSQRPAQPLQAQAAQPAAPAPATAAAPAPARAPAATAPAVAGRRSPAGPGPAAEAKAAPSKAAGTGTTVTARAGDTAGKIAAAAKPEGVSLDQMLVAMLRANPDAFVGGNINRLRAGAILDMPTAEQAAQVDAGDARRTLVAQSRDFNEFRRRLAEAVPTTARSAGGERQSSGKITAEVEDKRPAAAAPDKLTLSKGAAKGNAAEDKIARDRAARDASERVAALNRNISDLAKIGPSGPAGAASAAKGVALPVGAASVAKPAVTAAASAPAAAAPAVQAASVTAPVAAAASAPASAATPAAATASADASAPASALAASAAAPQAAASVAKPPAPAVRKPAPPAPEPSLLDDLLDNPMLPAGAGGLLAVLLGFGAYKLRQRKKSAQVDSSFLESRLQPDSFFGASGGQRIDTNETGSPTGSSMVYSPSQLDAAGDVDPVAEADVYLAYGRDLQAEEILKEALRSNPQRVAIHAKLLEIYAKRRDARSFESLAAQAHALTQGQGPEWEHICELGQDLDPANALYRGGVPAAAGVGMAALAAEAPSMATQALPRSELPGGSAAPAPDLDLDLDFSLDDTPAVAAEPERTQALVAQAPEAVAPLDMDFGNTPVPELPPLTQPMDMHTEAAALTATPPAPLEAAPALDANALSFDLDMPPSAPAAAAPAAAAADGGMIEFDLGALSLDLPGSTASAPASTAATQLASEDEGPHSMGLSMGGFDESTGDPLATKLALAQEFNAIGDPDGARSLAQEVIAEASGELKSRAQKFLAEIG